uniref:Integrase core domain containing protein n=1 Tax=Solanum tuberosum TaxID=4113 RepID=M1DTH3_SOLTU
MAPLPESGVKNSSISGSNSDTMDHPPLRLMIIRDNILNFKPLEGEAIYELWQRLKCGKCWLASKWSSRRITEEVGEPDLILHLTQDIFKLESVKLSEPRRSLANRRPDVATSTRGTSATAPPETNPEPAHAPPVAPTPLVVPQPRMLNRQGRSSEVPTLQADVAGLRRDVDYLKSVDFNDLMRTTEDRDAPGEAAVADADAETDEELTAAQEEQNIFGNLSDLVGTIVHPVIQASHAETSTGDPIGPGTAALDVTTSGTDAQLQTAAQSSDAPTGGEVT